MKKYVSILAIVLFTSLASFAQTKDFSMGISYQTKQGDETYKSLLGMNFDLYQENGFFYGFELAFNLEGIPEDVNYTGTINLGQFSEDFRGDYASNVIKFGGRVGKAFGDLNIIGTLGLNFLEEFQLRYDEYNILGNNGTYGVATGNNPVEGYYKLGLSYKIDKFLPEIGYSNNGISIGLNYML